MFVIGGIVCGCVGLVRMTVDCIAHSGLHRFNDRTGAMGRGNSERRQRKHQRQKC